MKRLVLSSAVLAAAAFGQLTPVEVVFTARSSGGETELMLSRENVSVEQDGKTLRVLDVTPIEGASAGLELFLLLDQNLSSEQMGSLGEFIIEQPPTTAIGIAVMRYGGAAVILAPTADHVLAVTALQIAGASAVDSSPYGALAAMLEWWRANTMRHAVLMVSDGLDLVDKDRVQQLTEHAQRDGITIYTICQKTRAAIPCGRTYMAQVARATGGAAYFSAVTQPASFRGYLRDLADRLSNQYRISFLAHAGEVGGLQTVRILTNAPGIEIIAPAQVWVPARIESF